MNRSRSRARLYLSLLAAVSLVALAVIGACDDDADAAGAKPTRTIVLVHGAFADGSSWDKVVPLLEAKGYHVVAVHESLASLADDVAATRRAIGVQAGDVLLVGHSYGGAVITSAGDDPKVAGLVYVAAFAPDLGESINDLGKGQPPPPWATQLVVDAGGFAWLPDATVLADFAQDLPAGDAHLLAVKQGPIFAHNFDDKMTAAAWRSKPSWYAISTQDHMIAPAAQAFMSSRMKATVTSVDASHVSMLSKPQQIANLILTAAEEAPAAAPAASKPAHRAARPAR